MVNPVNIDIEAVSDTEVIVVPGPLTVNALLAHRAREPRLVAGVAAWTSSDMFKVFVRISNSYNFRKINIRRQQENQKLKDGIVSAKNFSY